MVMHPNFILLITFLLYTNCVSCTNDDEFDELIVKQLVGKVKKPSTHGSCPQIVTEVTSLVRNDAESIDAISYEVTVRVCRKNCVLFSSLEEEQEQRQESHCQTCERTVTVQKEPFEILDEVDNGCDDDVSDDNELELRSSFEKFVKEYKKTYENKKVREERFRIFRDSLSKAKQLQENEKGTATYGINKFSDLTDEEFRASHGGYFSVSDYLDQLELPVYDENDLPAEVDWIKKGQFVTQVKDQEDCNSCWAFATTGLLESRYAIRHNKLLEFSEQELIDCDDSNFGCESGFINTALMAIQKQLGGLVKAADYKYYRMQRNCTVDRKKHKVSVKNFKRIEKFNAQQMAYYVAMKGPIAAALNKTILQHYLNGIIFQNCNTTPDHAALIVGYGYSCFTPFWKVKNSWGVDWGDKGYFQIYRGDNSCGIESDTYTVEVN